MSELPDPLATTLFGKTRQAVLALFFGDADRTFYLRQVVRLTGAGHGAVQRELAGLVRAGILSRNADGHQVYYRANRDCPIFEELKSLLLKTAGVVGVLRECLAPLAGQITVAFIFGSLAAGRETTASDVDLMIIGDVSFGDVVQALRPAQETITREVNPTVYPPPEFCHKLRDGHHFVGTVLDGPKVFLLGSDDDLARLAESGLAS
jgi:predicted nucleotidyltransferase